MVKISSASENEIKVYLSNWWTSINQQLEAATGSSVQIGQEVPIDMLIASEVGQRLLHIAAAAENLVEWSPQAAESILADCNAFEAWLNQASFGHRTPEEFWNTTLGYMVLKARLWAELDRLASLKEAAELSGLSLSSLSQRISRGQLKHYRDPSEANPQRARRIRLTDLDHFIREGIVRKPALTEIPRFSLPMPAIAPDQFHHAVRKNKDHHPQG
jgi:hypothetical protein